jgi:hypothetical protein
MDGLLRIPSETEALPFRVDAGLLGALARASAAIARLDQALRGHPLLPAFLYRTRLEAVRRQAAVDGQLIDPWHLAAVLEGLRLRLPDGLRIIDRGVIIDAARSAFLLHQWITAPDFDQEDEVRLALATLSTAPLPDAPLLAAALGCWEWFEHGGMRPPLRSAMIRFWVKNGIFRAPVPLTGPRSLSSEAPTEKDAWIRAFLEALASEALDYHQLLIDLEREWVAARACFADRRSNSRAGQAIDVLAAAPLLSATTLAGAIGMSIRRAIDLLDGFVRDELVVEVTHRAKRRLFALRGLTPMRDEILPPRRPEPGRRPGRPRNDEAEAEVPKQISSAAPLSPLQRGVFDYSVLEESMEHLESVIRRTRQALGTLRQAEVDDPSG